jgi:hypothetical protein
LGENIFWKDLGGNLLNFLTEKKLKALSLNFTREYVVVTMLGETLPIRSSELVIIGLLYFLM